MKLFNNALNKRIINIILFMFFSVSIFYLIKEVSAKNTPVILSTRSIIIPKVVVSSVLSGLPVNIKIPQIGVNAIVEHIGLTQDGEVGSPSGPNNTAWFKEGPIPGQEGNAIIDGHSGWKNNIPAVFDNLKKLKRGDKIYVENGEGEILVFEVKKLKIYHKNDVALDVFNSSDNKSHLNLITCIGEWNIDENGRDDRIVVFADLVEIEKLSQ